jgi:sugar lactone lactonase YvrE
MCVADSEKRAIEFWDYDKHEGRPLRLAVNVPIPASVGIPDGITVDTEDCFWLALAGGARLQRYSKAGALVSEVDLPALQPTSCTFGGEHLDQLFVTTAKYQMTREELERWPLSGAIFRVDTGAQGLPPDHYRP